MVGVGKVHKPNKQVLKDIYLSFFYGAKIGVLGLNGAGKSTLLRIIAGVDKDYLGEITSQKGITFGYLPQEPELDSTSRGHSRASLHEGFLPWQRQRCTLPSNTNYTYFNSLGEQTSCAVRLNFPDPVYWSLG